MHPLRALISIGTNSTRLLIVRPSDAGLEIVRHETREPRIGESLIEDGPLPPAAVERTLAVIREFAGFAAEAGAAVEGIATSALRRATDGERFREMFMDETRGASLRVLSGDEEARYSFLGATHDRRGRPASARSTSAAAATEFAVRAPRRASGAHDLARDRRRAHVERFPALLGDARRGHRDAGRASRSARAWAAETRRAAARRSATRRVDGRRRHGLHGGGDDRRRSHADRVPIDRAQRRAAIDE